MNDGLNNAAESYYASALTSALNTATMATFLAGAKQMREQPLTEKLNDDDRCKIIESVYAAYKLLESSEAACNAVLDILRTLFCDFNIVNNPNEICA